MTVRTFVHKKVDYLKMESIANFGFKVYFFDSKCSAACIKLIDGPELTMPIVYNTWDV